MIGSPPCTYFSLLQELDIAVHGKDLAWMARFEAAKQKAVRHVEFCCNMYRHQMANGRHFLHEHPARALSWSHLAIASISQMVGIHLVTADH